MSTHNMLLLRNRDVPLMSTHNICFLLRNKKKKIFSSFWTEFVDFRIDYGKIVFSPFRQRLNKKYMCLG